LSRLIATFYGNAALPHTSRSDLESSCDNSVFFTLRRERSDLSPHSSTGNNYSMLHQTPSHKSGPSRLSIMAEVASNAWRAKCRPGRKLASCV